MASSKFIVFAAAFAVLAISLASAQGQLVLKNHCLDKIKLDKKCADNIFGAIFKDGNSYVTEECCTGIVKLGKTCHDALAMWELENNPKYEQKKAQILPKISQTWNQCIAGAPAPSEV